MSSPKPRPRVMQWYERLTLLRAISTILVIATTIVLVAGFLARVVEPQTFTSIGLSYWWALTTVTTVGYGDVVPHTTAGRLVGSGLMFTGLALIPTTTSVVVSMLLSKFGRIAQHEQTERLERIEAMLESRAPGGDG
jgi:voltage-gated potassium channel